jgi:CBS domain-containing protein
MKISEAMSSNVRIASPNQSIRDAAQIMAEIDAGSLPVGEHDHLVGMITDRDIAVRAVARGLPPNTAIREVMTSDMKYCFEDEDVEHVARNMGENQLRRLPVVSRDKRLVGIVSIADIAKSHDGGTAGSALGSIAQPGGRHSQKSDGRTAS